MCQYMHILRKCIPNVNPTNHMANVDAALVISIGSTVKAGATFRVVKTATHSKR